jgi:hypothetical protein
MNTKSRIGALLAAAAVGFAAAAGQAQEQTDEAALERQIAALEPAVCAAQPQLCTELKAFAKAGTPCVPEGDQFTVGHAYLIGDDGTVRPAEYFVLRTQRSSELTLVQTQHVFSENAQEKEAAEALIAGIAKGQVDQTNPLYRYLISSSGQVPQLLAEPAARSLVVRAEGPVVYLRQDGKQLYSAVPDTVVRQPGGGLQGAGLLFCVLPAPTVCE